MGPVHRHARVGRRSHRRLGDRDEHGIQRRRRDHPLPHRPDDLGSAGGLANRRPGAHPVGRRHDCRCRRSQGREGRRGDRFRRHGHGTMGISHARRVEAAAGAHAGPGHPAPLDRSTAFRAGRQPVRRGVSAVPSVGSVLGCFGRDRGSVEPGQRRRQHSLQRRHRCLFLPCHPGERSAGARPGRCQKARCLSTGGVRSLRRIGRLDPRGGRHRCRPRHCSRHRHHTSGPQGGPVAISTGRGRRLAGHSARLRRQRLVARPG